MVQITTVSKLRINKLTQAQYEELVLNDQLKDDELYLTVDGNPIDCEIEHSTEEHAGIIEIADQEEVINGESDGKAITPKKLNDNYYNKGTIDSLLDEKQDVINDLETIKSNASSAKSSVDTHIANGTIHVTASDKIAWSNKQNALVSGTNIKTINNESLLGEGNIDISINTSNLTVNSNIVPDTTAIYDLGSEDKRFKAIYVDEAYLSTNTLYLGDTPVLGTSSDTINIKADEDQSILVKTTGEGSTQLLSDKSVDITSKLDNSSVNITARGNNGAVNISGTKDINLTATNISLSGSTTIANLNVTGTTTTVHSQDLSVKDNLIEINAGETGSGVSAGQAGLKVNRGDLPDYRIMFDEADDMFKVGMNGDLETIASQDYVNTQLESYSTSSEVEDLLDEKQDTLVSGTNIKTIGGESILGSGDISNIATKTELNSKQDVITDLATIRDGASKGATALQSFTETDPTVPSYVKSITQANITDWNNKSTFSGDYNDLTNKPTIPTVPTNISAFTNDSGYITSDYHDDTKQDTLIAGTNIKTINGESILGSGNIEVGGDSIAEAVKDQNRIEIGIKTWTGTLAEYNELLPTESWYAWGDYFTKSATPQIGDKIYNNDKTDSGKVISAISNNTISFEE